MRNPSRFHGLLVVDKPGGITSRDAVNRAQRWFPRGTPIGHTGTLDPLATGVLVLTVGAATRLSQYVQLMEKVYRSRFRLGARSDTDDADGTITLVASAQPVERAVVETALTAFVGEIEQVPPAYSAAKLEGHRAYDLARKGEAVELQARMVRVHAIDVLAYEWPYLDLEVRCGKGTYIRSLARDLGERLSCGGLVETLRRTRVGTLVAEKGLSLEASPQQAQGSLLPLKKAIDELPMITLMGERKKKLSQGQAVPLPEAELRSGEWAIFDERDELLAIGEWDAQQRLMKPLKVFKPTNEERV